GQRIWMSSGLSEIHDREPALAFAQARQVAAAALMEREPAVFPHASLMEGHDRFTRLPRTTVRRFRPLHRASSGFPSPVELFREMGAREWFAPLGPRTATDYTRRYCADRDELSPPTLSLALLDRRPAGPCPVFDLAVEETHAFIAATVAVHNCIGNSGPLPEAVAEAVGREDLVVAAVLSGNRNFEGRVNPTTRANYLASPPLVVAYAL